MLENEEDDLIINDNEEEINGDKNQEVEEDEEEKQLISQKEKESKENLIKILKRLENNLDLEANKEKTINEVYQALLNSDDITKRELKEKTNSCLLIFMFYFIAPLFGIIFLIGIFQLISLKKTLSGIIKDSVKHYGKCTFQDDCNIILYNNQTNETYINVYDFYNYFYNSSMNETIDFNLMMITGFVGDSLLKSRGFRLSSGILSLFNFGCLFWLYCFHFNFEKDGIFDYGIIKILCIIVCYLILLIGIGGSALLSLKILGDSHLKYKNYVIKQKQKELDDADRELKSKISKQMNLLTNDEGEKNIDGNKKNEKRESKNVEEKKGITDEERQNQREKSLKKREKNQMDFFFMICVIITLGYYGKYGINLLINFILKKIYEEGYNKEKYFFCVIGLYFSSLLLSISIYSIFVCIFTKNRKEEDKGNKYRICQICGYIIYSEKKSLVKKNRKYNNSCCEYIGLCCESTKNCCNEVGCSLCSICKEDENDDCECCCCDYDEENFDKKMNFFVIVIKHRENFIGVINL